MRLILRLVLQLIGIALLCLALAAAATMVNARKSVEAEVAASTERVARHLEGLFWHEILWRGAMRRDGLTPVPDWEQLATLKLVSPGVCIHYGPGDEPPRALCSRLEGVGLAAPEWFAQTFARVFGPPAPVRRPLTVRQPETGAVVGAADAGAAVRLAWREISVILSVASAMAFGICVLSALAVAHALAPTREIVAGLRRLENGDYRRRINSTSGGELGLIARAADDLAARLADVTAERSALTKRLFEVQEEERRALARDLHDEFGQCLTATLAYAGSIETAAGERADLADDARAIAGVARRMMTTLRAALARLRSQDLEELGLETCLVQLVAGWNARGAPKTVVRLDLAGGLAALPREIATNVYRIAQESVTNALRHGAPTDVSLRIENAAAPNRLALVVEDDGGGDPARFCASGGQGILGLRERVAALGGVLSITRAARGVRVDVSIPLTPAHGEEALSAA